MPYSLEYTDRATHALARLDPKIADSIRRKLDRLAEYADSVRHEALTGQYSGSFKLKLGAYRAVYNLDRTNRLISVRIIGHRREVYD